MSEKMDVSYDIGGMLTVRSNGTTRTFGFKGFNRDAIENPVSDEIYKYSPNQKKTIIAKTEKIIDAYDTGDCPTILRMLLEEIKGTS